jgi:hypothetical protein
VAAQTKTGEINVAVDTMVGNVKTQSELARTSFGTMTAGFVTDSATVATSAQTMATNTNTAVGSMQSTLAQYGPNIGTPLKTGMQSTSTDVIAALQSILDKIADVISAMTGIHVPKIQIPTPGGSGGGSTGGGTSGGSSGGSGGGNQGGNGGGNGVCFAAGTLILLADGTQQPIEQVRAGDWVASFEPQAMAAGGRKLITGLVLETSAHQARDYYQLRFAHGTIVVTGEHPFYAPSVTRPVERVHGEFIRVKDLQIGDRVEAWLGQRDQVQLLEMCREVNGEPITVYNFQVMATHTYIAAGCLVHNKEARAYGGAMYPGRRYLFNENAATRPEIIIPKTAGYALTRKDAMSALSRASAGEAGNGPTSIYVTVPIGQVSNDLDIEMLAYRVAQRIARRR